MNREVIGSALNGNYSHSAGIMRKFVQDVRENKFQLSKEDCEFVLGCYLINKWNYPWEEHRYHGITQQYLLDELKVPDCLTISNQLRGNVGNHAQEIESLFESLDLMDQLNPNLVAAFCDVYRNLTQFPPENTTRQPLPSIPAPELTDLATETQTLLREALNQDLAVFVVGTGVSIANSDDRATTTFRNGNPNDRIGNYVTWGGLLENLKETLVGMHGDVINNQDWQDTANDFQARGRLLREAALQINGGPTDFRRFIDMYLSRVMPASDTEAMEYPDRHPKKPSYCSSKSVPFLLELFDIPIMTTNYDMLLELALNRTPHNMDPRPYNAEYENEEDDEYLQLLFKTQVFHIHGLITEAYSIIMEENLHTFDSFRLALTSWFSGRSLIFIGCKGGALEYHFRTYFDLCPDLQHFIFLTKQEHVELWDDNVYGEFYRNFTGRGSLIPVLYDVGANYNSLGGYLREILLVMEVYESSDTAPFQFTHPKDRRMKLHGEYSKHEVVHENLIDPPLPPVPPANP